ncbi:MAG: DNA-3-methyladenine glycosylase [Zymomonas mobilis]|uniref:DNA-3-methyladenine glycosylase II n=1 Tax=Zymomonas mobilis TaxID=542 RepID=A0A542W020_ZYMMB|nr:DNA-3-methyladenine glycosylase [Zymomonas mobilis]TQL16873.1 DNA-3-methyladenine glycosylase II [Zymomonas mobilis]
MTQSLSQQNIEQKLDEWAIINPLIKDALHQYGYPHYKAVEKGIASLARTIIGQQLHTKVADQIWQRVSECLGEVSADAFLSVDEEDLRQCGLSPAKINYLKDLAKRSATDLDLSLLPQNDGEAIDLLMSVHGIGRWTAENYLIFAERRSDIWPAADLGIRIAVGCFYKIPERPDVKKSRELGNDFCPYRSVMALFLWHQYTNKNYFE